MACVWDLETDWQPITKKTSGRDCPCASAITLAAGGGMREARRLFDNSALDRIAVSSPNPSERPDDTRPKQGEGGGFGHGRCTRTADDQRVHLDTCGGEIAEDGQRVIATNPAR